MNKRNAIIVQDCCSNGMEMHMHSMGFNYGATMEMHMHIMGLIMAQQSDTTVSMPVSQTRS